MFDDSLSSFLGVVEIASNNNIIKDLYIDGNIEGKRQMFAGSPTYTGVGIYLKSGENNTVINNRLYNNTSSGITIESSNNIISNNICMNSYSGIEIGNNSNNNNVSVNICSNNIDYGIYLYNSCNKNIISGNICNNEIDYGKYGIYLRNSYNNVISGNSSYGNRKRHEGTGIYLDSSSNNIISGNNCRNNDVNGIFLISSSNNAIVGNIFSCDNYGTGTPEVSTYAGEVVVGSQRWGIKLSGENNNDNLIAYNSIMGENYVTEGGTGNTFIGNKYS